MKKYTRIAVWICICCIFFTGCGGRASKPSGPVSETNAAETENIVYVPSYSKIGFEGSVDIGMYTLFLLGDHLYQTGPDIVTAMELSTGERTEKEINGYSWKRTGNGFASISSMAKKIYVYDESFEQTGEIDLTAYGAVLQGSVGYSDFTVDTKGRGAVLYGNTIYVLDREGEYLFSLEKTDEIQNFSKVFSGKNEDLYVLAFDNGGQAAVYPIDIEGQRLGEKLANVPDIGSSVIILPVNEEEIYFAGSELYLYNTVSQTCSSLCVLREYGIAPDPVYDACGVLADGNFGIIEVENPVFGGGWQLTEELELIRIEAKRAEEVQERTELILAAMEAPAEDMLQPILDFNKYNPDYYITIREYIDEVDPYSDNYSQEYELARQHLNNDLVAGKVADIFLVNGWRGIDVMNLTRKGVIADLYQLMDQDEDIDREDFLPNILAAMEYEGKLCLMSPYFTVSTLAGKAEYLAGYDRLDYETLTELIKEHPGAALAEGEPLDIFDIMIRYSMDGFYDVKTGECGFDSREFMDLLEFVKSLPVVSVDYNNYYDELFQKLYDGEILLEDTSVMTPYDIQTMAVYFGGEVSCIGYPVSDGSGNRLAFSYFLAVSELSEHKEGAWALVKEYLTGEAQENLSSVFTIPVMQKSYEQWLKNAMENDGYPMGYGSGITIQCKALSQEEAGQLDSLVASATETTRYDTAIYNIIMEEVQGYFAGSKTAEETAGIIQSRVQLYLDEQGD